MSRFARSGALVVLVFSAVLLPLRAAAQPVLSVSPTSVNLQGTAGSNVTSSTVRISNAGNRALRWSIVSPTVPWLTVSPSRGVNSGTLTLTFQTSGLPAGQHLTSFRVETESGSPVTVSVEINLGAARVVPTLAVACPSAMTVSSSTGSAMAVSYSATTSGGVAPVTVSGNPASGSMFPVGTTTVSVNAKSSDGQTASCNFPVTVTSTVARLTVSCPSNMTVASSNGSPVAVTYSATTSGGVAPVTVSGNPASGSMFPVGTTTVSVNAKSSDGQTASCNFPITVTSTVARLIVSCPSNTTVASSNGSSVPVTYSPTTSGGVAPVTVNASPSSGSQFAVGTTTVQVNASSSDGQTASCSFTVTVTVPPSGDWTFCASEGGFCAFSGTTNVRYGANGAYFYKSLSGGTACTNSVFGDPAHGTPKQCWVGGTAPTPTPTTPSYGPRSTITCPIGALDIWPGSVHPAHCQPAFGQDHVLSASWCAFADQLDHAQDR